MEIEVTLGLKSVAAMGRPIGWDWFVAFGEAILREMAGIRPADIAWDTGEWAGVGGVGS